MNAYLHVRAEMKSGKVDAIDLGARQAERDLQADEAAAWKTRRGR